MKHCKGCGHDKPRSEFYKARSTKDGLQGRCKSCAKDYQRQWHRDNPTYRKTYQEKNKELARTRYTTSRSSQWHSAVYNLRKYRGMSEEDLEVSFEYRDAIESDPCKYCGTLDTGVEYHVDHFIPVAFPHGVSGNDSWHNLVRACQPCNNRKKNHCGTWMLLK